ncbi:MAG: hypothetical protein PVJ68_09120 [Candidatus Thiodiazotropha sp.]
MSTISAINPGNGGTTGEDMYLVQVTQLYSLPDLESVKGGE